MPKPPKSTRTDDTPAQPPVPTLTTLLTMVTLAHQVFDRLPPSAVNIPALKQFYDLSKYHGLAPKNAPHIPDDGRI